MKKNDAPYDIFISYRRDNGWDTAKHLRDILTAKGYSVFFDVDSLRSGDFNRALLDVIKNCTDFIIILSPNALDRCVNEGDWVRQELACALESGKNVIPVISGKFHFPETLPEDINAVRWKNAITVNITYFDAMVEKLISFLHSKPRKKPILRWLLPVIVFFVLAAMFFVPRLLGQKTDTPVPLSSPQSSLTDYFNTVTMEVGGIIELGSYEQDNDLDNGTEPIQWRILSIENDRILVISDQGLDAKQFHENIASITWEACSLRSWLNNDFLAASFTPEEQALIQTVTTENKANPNYNTEAGNNTRDRVFLLSLTEAEKYFNSNEDRQCKATAYAVAQGCHVINLMPFAGNCAWWLRTPGETELFALQISVTGSADDDGMLAGSSVAAVRPALWIGLSN